jgi:hypothetical protein
VGIGDEFTSICQNLDSRELSIIRDYINALSGAILIPPAPPVASDFTVYRQSNLAVLKPHDIGVIVYE